ncbi:uncharacterized protein METZ01_LOCUS230191 [marine metagenome]|uniref:Uncharacterized protein n=1 Tax=marine metagenome TaxID=408172 RepID=A0A382GRR5_9ZZZZ
MKAIEIKYSEQYKKFVKYYIININILK